MGSDTGLHKLPSLLGPCQTIKLQRMLVTDHECPLGFVLKMGQKMARMHPCYMAILLGKWWQSAARVRLEKVPNCWTNQIPSIWRVSSNIDHLFFVLPMVTTGDPLGKPHDFVAQVARTDSGHSWSAQWRWSEVPRDVAFRPSRRRNVYHFPVVWWSVVFLTTKKVAETCKNQMLANDIHGSGISSISQFSGPAFLHVTCTGTQALMTEILSPSARAARGRSKMLGRWPVDDQTLQQHTCDLLADLRGRGWVQGNIKAYVAHRGLCLIQYVYIHTHKVYIYIYIRIKM